MPPRRDYRLEHNPHWKGGASLQPGYYTKWKARRRESIQRFLLSVALTVGCEDCGYNTNAYALEFDHIQIPGPCRVPARANTIYEAATELFRCKVRCANCHTIRHREEGE